MCAMGNMLYVYLLTMTIISVSSREIHRNVKILNQPEDNDTVVIENPAFATTQSHSTINPRQYGSISADDNDDDDKGFDLETIFKAFLEAAAVVEKLTAGLDNEEGRDEMGTKKLSIFAQFNPSQIFEPIGNKFSELSEALTHPNFGFSLPNPGHIWNKIKEAGANIFQGANSAIFGAHSQHSGDYPFPYRQQLGRGLREQFENYEGTVVDQALKRLAYWREKLVNYNGSALSNVKINRTNINNPYFFPFYPGSDRLVNGTGN